MVAGQFVDFGRCAPPEPDPLGDRQVPAACRLRRAIAHDVAAPATFVGARESNNRYVTLRPLDVRLATLDATELVLFGSKDSIFDVEPSLARYMRTVGVTVPEIAPGSHSSVLEAQEATASHILTFLRERARPE